MKFSLGNSLFALALISFALAWLVDHRAQESRSDMLQSDLNDLRIQLRESDAGNALTRGYLNFFRMEDSSAFTAMDYRDQLRTLNREYSRRFPAWATTQMPLPDE